MVTTNPLERYFYVCKQFHIRRGKRTLGRNSNYVLIPLFRILSPPLVLKVVKVVFRDVSIKDLLMSNVNTASVRHQAVLIPPSTKNENPSNRLRAAAGNFCHPAPPGSLTQKQH
jgi:hypothetical protein